MCSYRTYVKNVIAETRLTVQQDPVLEAMWLCLANIALADLGFN